MMNNKLIKKGFLKPFTLCSLAVLTMATLTSCGKSADIYEGINPDEEYVTLGNKNQYSVTNKEVYDNFRWSSSSVIQEKLNQAIIQKYLTEVETKVNELDEDYIANVQNYLICDVFAVTDVDSADELNNPYLEKQKKIQYIDTVYQKYAITLDEAQLDALLVRDKKEHKSTLTKDKYQAFNENQKAVFAKYFDNYAKKLFARDYLANEIKTHDEEKDEDEDAYYTDSEIKTYWNENYKYKEALNAILIRFNSQNEANAVLKTFGLKTYRSRLYYLPQNEKSDAEYSKYYDDYDFTDNTTDAQQERIDLTNQKSAMMLSLYVEMYNYVYPYREKLNNIPGIPANSTSNRRDVTQKILDSFSRDNEGSIDVNNVSEFYEKYLKSSEDSLTYTGESLDEINSSLKSYLYTTLKAPAKNDTTADINQMDAYSYQPQSYGDYYFMAFKVYDANVNKAEKLYFSDSSETKLAQKADDANLTETEFETFKNFVESLKAELMEDELTQTYIDNAISDSVENCKIYIYDQNVEIAYLSSNSNYSRTRKKTDEGGLVAQITYTNPDDKKDTTTVSVKAVDIWNELEPTSGISTAVDLLSQKVIKDTKVYEDVVNDKEKVDEFYDTLNILLANFANGQLSSYGYDSSIGKYNFMMLYFHTNKIDEIIKNYYCINEASTKLLTDYSSDALAKLLQESANAYSKTFKVSGSNLLAYVDMNEDGNPDRDFDWTQELPVAVTGATTYGDLAKMLMKDVIALLNNSEESNVDTLSNIVSEFNSSGRFTNGFDQTITDGQYDPTNPETYWAKYKVNGLYLKVEEVADVSNTSQYSTVNDVLKIAMYKTYQDNKYIFDKDGENPAVPNEYLETSYYEDGADGLLSVNGYNLYTLTSASINDTAEFKEEDDPNGIFTNIKYIYNDEVYTIENVYSENGEFTLNQVKAYLLEYANSQTSASLPESISNAITNSLKPMYSRFTSETSQFYLIVSYLEAEVGMNVGSYDAFNFKSSTNKTASKERFEKLLNISQRNQEGYLVNDVYDETTPYTFFNQKVDGISEGQRLLAEMENLYQVGNSTWWDLLAEYASAAYKKGEN